MSQRVVVAAPLLQAPSKPPGVDASPLELVLASRAVATGAVPDGLGEGPVWDGRTSTLYWVDITGQCLNSARFFDAAPGTVTTVNASAHDAVVEGFLKNARIVVCRVGLPFDTPGFVALTPDPRRLAFGSQHGVGLLHAASGRVLARGPHPSRAHSNHRFNDGKPDPSGALVAGTMQMKRHAKDVRVQGSATVYRFAPASAVSANAPFGGGDGDVTRVAALDDSVGKVTVSNGLGWSPDGRTFFYVDTPTKQLVRFAYDVTAPARVGNVAAAVVAGSKKVLHEFSDGFPDGLCVDASGDVWVAILDRAEVRCVHGRTGQHTVTVRVPGVKHVTSCCFGGPGLRLLFITTAAGTTADAVAATRDSGDVLSGQVFVCDVGVAGAAVAVADVFPARVSKL